MKAFIVLIGLVVLSVPLSASLVVVDPDGLVAGTDISNAWAGVALSSGGGTAGLDGKVYAASTTYAGTGGMVFGNKRGTSLSKAWLNSDTNGYYFQANFVNPVNYVSINVVSTSGTSYPYLSYGTTAGAFIQLSPDLSPTIAGQIRTYEIGDHATANIAYVRFGGYVASPNYSVYLDKLQFEVPEPTTCLILLSGALLLKRRKT